MILVKLDNELKSLKQCKEAVGGYIDIVGLDDNVCILLNDEEKLIGLEGNRRIGNNFCTKSNEFMVYKYSIARIITM
ncbi:DUF3846 domain-containing protein [Anaerotignum lactatifermentans]|uniref:DUF3846 domain-containing protein n=1 Tax=Anaerotignum lactatifermentans TaxID=160404 RepID=UPI003FA41214